VWRSNPLQAANWGLAALFVSSGLLLPARLRAAEPVDLDWNVPAGCPSAARVNERIRKLAGPIKTSSTPLRAEATVTRREDGKLHLHLVVHAGDAVGARDIDAKSCDDLAGVAAVALALLLRSPDPLAAKDLSAAPEDVSHGDGTSPGNAPDSMNPTGPDNPGPPSTAAEPTQPNTSVSPPAAVEPPPAPKNERPSTPRNWHPILRAPTAAFGVGPLPGATLGIMAGAGVELASWSIFLDGALWHSRSIQAHDDPRFGAELERTSATFALCYAFDSGRWAIAPCTLVGVEHASARGTGNYVAARTAGATWLAPGLALEARLRLASWLELVTSARAQVETAQPKVTIDPAPGYEAVTPDVGHLAPAAATLVLGPQFIW